MAVETHQVDRDEEACASTAGSRRTTRISPSGIRRSCCAPGRVRVDGARQDQYAARQRPGVHPLLEGGVSRAAGQWPSRRNRLTGRGGHAPRPLVQTLIRSCSALQAAASGCVSRCARDLPLAAAERSVSPLGRRPARCRARLGQARSRCSEIVAAKPAGPAPRPTSARIAAPAVRRPAEDDKDAAFLRSITPHEDRDVMVLNKPYGLAVQGGSGTYRHVDGLMESLRTEEGVKPRLVHRIDKDTSGILLVARSRLAAATLAKTYRSRAARKVYWAPVPAYKRPRQGRTSTYLAKDDAAERMRVARHARTRRVMRSPTTPSSIRRPEAYLAVAEAGDRAHAPAARAHRPYWSSDCRRSEVFRYRELAAARRPAESPAPAGASAGDPASARGPAFARRVSTAASAYGTKLECARF